MKLTVDLSADVHRDLLAYAEVLVRETGQSVIEPTALIAPMLARFMATNRVFAKIRRETIDFSHQTHPAKIIRGMTRTIPKVGWKVTSRIGFFGKARPVIAPASRAIFPRSAASRKRPRREVRAALPIAGHRGFG